MDEQHIPFGEAPPGIPPSEGGPDGAAPLAGEQPYPTNAASSLDGFDMPPAPIPSSIERRGARQRETVDLARVAQLARDQLSRELDEMRQRVNTLRLSLPPRERLWDRMRSLKGDLTNLQMSDLVSPRVSARVHELREGTRSTMGAWRHALHQRSQSRHPAPPPVRATRPLDERLTDEQAMSERAGTRASATRPLLPPMPPLPEWRVELPQWRIPPLKPSAWPRRTPGPAKPPAPPKVYKPAKVVRPAAPSVPARAVMPPRTAAIVAPRASRPFSRPFSPVSPNATRKLREPRRRMLLVSSLIVVASMFISLLIPGLAAASAMKDYNDLKALGEQALHHLLAAKDDLAPVLAVAGKSSSGSSSPSPSLGSCSTTTSTAPAATSVPASPTKPAASPGASSSGSASATSTSGKLTAALDPQAFKAAQSELQAAQGDFQLLRTRLSRPDWVVATAASLPGLDSKLRSIEALADVGNDASSLGTEVIDAALPIVTRLHGASSLAGDTELLTQADLTRIQAAAADAQVKLADIQGKLGDVNLADLPLCASQRDEIQRVEAALPQIRSTLAQGTQLLGVAGWLLGVDHPRNFLVQTLDRSELRPSGGFTGNYGVLTLQNGKLDPFTLYNVNDIDYGLRTNGWIFGRRPPSQYSWWPFANWGLRDSNLSADFPTSAKLIEQVFANEGGGSVDGVIQVSPTAIAHVLLVTGPLVVPVFNDTVTADNLEDKIHFYEEDPAGIAIQQKLFPDDHTHSLRKRFTQMVVQLLQAKVKQLPPNQLLDVGKQFVKDLQAKDVQIYVNNPQLEDLLTQLQASGAADTTAGIDGYFLTQANVSVAKLTPYVQMTQTDDVTLDDNGGATHHLVMTFHNNPTGPIYGFPTYRDYVRIYAPPQAQLKHANGFDTGAPLCWAPSPGFSTKPDRFANVPDCGGNPYPSRALVCPAGAYGPGPMSYTVFGGDPNTPWVLDRAGGPTNTASDIAGRSMWGGYVVVPRRCTATLTLDYYVPGVAAPASTVPGNAAPYTMLVQRQGGTFYTVTVTIHPSAKMAASGLQTTKYTAQVSDNTAFTLGKPNPQTAAQFFGLGPYGSLLGLDKG